MKTKDTTRLEAILRLVKHDKISVATAIGLIAEIGKEKKKDTKETEPLNKLDRLMMRDFWNSDSEVLERYIPGDRKFTTQHPLDFTDILTTHSETFWEAYKLGARAILQVAEENQLELMGGGGIRVNEAVRLSVLRDLFEEEDG